MSLLPNITHKDIPTALQEQREFDNLMKMYKAGMIPQDAVIAHVDDKLAKLQGYMVVKGERIHGRC